MTAECSDNKRIGGLRADNKVGISHMMLWLVWIATAAYWVSASDSQNAMVQRDLLRHEEQLRKIEREHNHDLELLRREMGAGFGRIDKKLDQLFLRGG